MRERRRPAFDHARRSVAVVIGAACLVLVLTAACNGVLGIPEVQLASGDGGPIDGTTCAPGQKVCGAVCVSILDPSTGCGAASCEPCAFAHATAACIMGECAIETCEEGFGNCNAVRADGCEVDLRVDLHNCMMCGVNCDPFDCVAGICICNNNAQCDNGGVCQENVCTCGTNTCSSGAACIDATTCEF